MHEPVMLSEDVVALLREEAAAQGREIGAVASDKLRLAYAFPQDDERWEPPDYLSMTPEERAATFAAEQEEFRRYDESRTPEQKERDRQEALEIVAHGLTRSNPPEEVVARIKAKFAYLRETKIGREVAL